VAPVGNWELWSGHARKLLTRGPYPPPSIFSPPGHSLKSEPTSYWASYSVFRGAYAVAAGPGFVYIPHRSGCDVPCCHDWPGPASLAVNVWARSRSLWRAHACDKTRFGRSQLCLLLHETRASPRLQVAASTTAKEKGPPISFSNSVIQSLRISRYLVPPPPLARPRSAMLVDFGYGPRKICSH
jgi:hypothetical protein